MLGWHTPSYIVHFLPSQSKKQKRLKMMSLRLSRTQLSVFKTTLDNSKLEFYVSLFLCTECYKNLQKTVYPFVWFLFTIGFSHFYA
jgi:hypothetical protein